MARRWWPRSRPGRIVNGGGTAIGWATSTDGGSTWTHGFLPGLTTGNGGGLYDAASDPAVAYDAKHGVWMIASLPISNTTETLAVVVSRSTDGGFTWDNPVSVGPKVVSSDKNWIACDSTRPARSTVTATSSGTIPTPATGF